MTLKEQVMADVKEAMKAGNQEKLTVLRGLQAALANRLIEKRASDGTDAELTAEESLKVISSEAKKRRDSIEAFSSGGRSDLAEKEKTELGFIETYLPAQLSRDEIEAKVSALLSANPEVKDLGGAIRLVMAELQGQADGKIVSEIIKQKLNG